MKNLIDLYESIQKKSKKTKSLDTSVKLTSYKSSYNTSKAWILPDSSIVPLKSMWHHEWLIYNKELILKKFKVDLESFINDEHKIRLHALNNGFFRINYEYNGGTLIVEGNYNYFRKNIKDAIFILIADNLHAIDNINISLLNEQGKTVKSGSSNVMMYDDSEKLEHIPLITESIKKTYKIDHYIPPKII